MLLSLVIFAVPLVTHLADTPPLGRLGAQIPQISNFQLEKIPLAVQPEDTKVPDELAQLRDSAGQGDLDAQTKLGIMYYWGEGAPLDWAEAQVWLRKAAERGSREAQAKLGAMCFLGQGGPKNLDESIKWFRAAAEQGEPYSEGCIGVMYAVGEGLPKNLPEAFYWLYQAKAGGDDDAAEPLEQVKRFLSPSQLQEGIRRASDAIRSHASK